MGGKGKNKASGCGHSTDEEATTSQSQPHSHSHEQFRSEKHFKVIDALPQASTAFLSRILRRLRTVSSLRARHRVKQEIPSDSDRAIKHDPSHDPASPQNSEEGSDSDMAQARPQKEGLTPVQSLAVTLSRLTVGVQPDKVPQQKNLEIKPPNPPDRTPEEKKAHEHFTNEALEMARLALRTNETPVGCVLVHKGTIIAKGMNATNVTRNGTRHAEFMALSSLFALPRGVSSGEGKGNGNDNGNGNGETDAFDYAKTTDGSIASEEQIQSGHLFPYGQKFHPAARVDKSIIKECFLYVTVEPCVMCASLLRQLGIKKVFFGAVNDKFGGTGGVFRIHENTSDPLTRQPGQEIGDGGNVEAGFEAEGGWGRDEAVGLLRRFYVQENGRAPVPRKKEGRAARLAALEREAAERNHRPMASQDGDVESDGSTVHDQDSLGQPDEGNDGEGNDH